MTRITDTDLKAEKVYFKLSENEREFAKTWTTGEFQKCMKRWSSISGERSPSHFAKWIRLEHLSRLCSETDLKEATDKADQEESHSDWASRVIEFLTSRRKAQIQAILEPYKDFIARLEGENLVFNTAWIPIQNPKITHKDLVQYVLEERKK